MSNAVYLVENKPTLLKSGSQNCHDRELSKGSGPILERKGVQRELQQQPERRKSGLQPRVAASVGKRESVI